MIVDVIMPKMGESITEGTILEWKKSVGDKIDRDETLLEISTDKVDSEVPCPAEGVVAELLFDVNAVVEVGSVIARIAGDEAEAAAVSDTESKPEVPAPEPQQEISPEPAPDALPEKDGRFYTPLVKSIAKEKGIPISELSQVHGTGSHGRVTKKDLLDWLEIRKQESDKPAAAELPHLPAEPVADKSGEPALSGRTEKMNRIRKLIADHMVSSLRTSAHVYSTSEADITNIVHYRTQYKEAFKARHGISLTYTPVILEACVRALQEFSLFNTSVDGDTIIHHPHINMGVAVSLPDDNLIVPVIKKAEQKNFLGLAKETADLAARARSNQLNPDDIADSTFSVTNPGMFGSLFGMAIINQPNVGILSVGAVHKRPVVKESEYGDVIVPRSMMYLSIGYDHRIIDGAYGTRFLSRVVELLQNFNPEQVTW